MNDIETIYSVLKSAGLVKNTDDFSVRYMLRSSSYFRMARSTQKHSLSSLAALSSRLYQTANALKGTNIVSVAGLAIDLSNLSDKLWHQIYSRSLDGTNVKS